MQHLPRIIDELLPYYGADCPFAVVHRASWPDQDWVRGTLADIEARVAVKGFRRTALILVGRVLATDDFAQSALYAEAGIAPPIAWTEPACVGQPSRLQGRST